MLMMPAGARAGISGSIDVVSDYRFRGVSLSGGHAALQATVNVSRGPFFVEGFVTTLGGSGSDADVETDLTVGGTRKLGPGTATLSATWYLYPGGHQSGVYEIIGRYDLPIGQSTVSVTAGYAPSQHSLYGRDNLYLGLSATIPVGRPKLIAAIGRERGALTPKTKIDWQIGAQMSVAGFDASLSYIDCNRGLRDWNMHGVSKATVLFQIGHEF